MSRDNIIEAEARKRIKAQMPLDEKVKRADLVIKNNGNNILL
jgi:dephospho-CoA kinase